MRIDAGVAEQLKTRYPGQAVARPLIEDVTASREPDPDWLFRDAAGHTHRWVAPDGEEVWWSGEIPTTELVVTSSYWCLYCNGLHEKEERRCAQCGEVVTPRYVRPACRRQIVRWYELEPFEFTVGADGDMDHVPAGLDGEMINSMSGYVHFTHRATGDVFRVISYEQPWPAMRHAVVKCYPAALFNPVVETARRPPSKGARS